MAKTDRQTKGVEYILGEKYGVDDDPALVTEAAARLERKIQELKAAHPTLQDSKATVYAALYFSMSLLETKTSSAQPLVGDIERIAHAVTQVNKKVLQQTNRLNQTVLEQTRILAEFR